VSVIPIALRMPSAPLAERLASRVNAQFDEGIVHEVKQLLARGIPESARPFGGLVYRQVLEYLHGVRSEAETRALIVQENRRYARRQLIWFRKEPNLMWFDGPGESPEVQARVLRWLAERGFLIHGGPADHA
jgi:tRNA dimethylallyltransferase